jgi:rhodanese-related sulfurtransferase
MKYAAVISILLAVVIILTGCTANDRSKEELWPGGDEPGAELSGTSREAEADTEEIAPSYSKISAEEAKKLLDNEKGIILLDVRTREEHDAERIAGSMLIPYDRLEEESASSLPDKDAAIVVYCRSGRRSAIAADILVKLGYKKVYDMGGIQDWPYETEKGG